MDYKYSTSDRKARLVAEKYSKAASWYVEGVLKPLFKDECKVMKDILAKHNLHLIAANFEYAQSYKFKCNPNPVSIVKHNHLHFLVAVHASRVKDLLSVHKLIIQSLRKDYEAHIKEILNLDPEVKIFKEFNGKKYGKDMYGKTCKLSFPEECPVKSHCPYADKCMGAKGFCPNYITCVKLDKKTIEDVLMYILRDKKWEMIGGNFKDYVPQYKKYYYVDKRAIKRYISIAIDMPILDPHFDRSNQRRQIPPQEVDFSIPTKIYKKGCKPQTVIDNNYSFNYLDRTYIDIAEKIRNEKAYRKYVPENESVSYLYNLDALYQYNLSYAGTEGISVIHVTKSVPYVYEYSRLRETISIYGEDTVVYNGKMMWTNQFHVIANNGENTSTYDSVYMGKTDGDRSLYEFDLTLYGLGLSDIKTILFFTTYSPKGSHRVKESTLLVNIHLNWLPPTAS